jgi:aryl-alcohol dehydrogenase-like predicted oxidoreductase
VSDHRSFNRHGESFDAVETFSGVDYEAGLRAVEELRPLVPAGATMAQLALRWILMFPEVTAAIPVARNPAQVEGNVGALALPILSRQAMDEVRAVYDRHVRALVHDRW